MTPSGDLKAEGVRGGRSAYDRVVEAWNRLGPHQRASVRRECIRNGHDWRNVVSEGQVVYVICARCCDYQR